jgi:hypothetical protein
MTTRRPSLIPLFAGVLLARHAGVYGSSGARTALYDTL